MTDVVRAPDAALCERLAKLYAAAFGASSRPWSPHEIAEIAGRGFLIVGESGFAAVGVAADEAELITVAVDPDRHRTGVGRAILADAEQAARNAGAARLLLEVAEDNRAARALYAAAGYQPVGRRLGYYKRDEGQVDAVVMEKALGR